MITYLIVSYLLGLVIFIMETILAPANRKWELLNFRMCLWALSPLTAWHGVLHYLQFFWCKLTKRPVKYWI